ncbi:MAG: hypothetical protein K2M95_02520, partial [Clostridiales bacterium]|nr:hypothetical protein [Clostridiales bacterium]
MGVDFAANASSKAIKEDISLSATEKVIGTYSATKSMVSVSLGAGTYRLEAWGAQGGSGMNGSTAGIGGTGGYVKANLTLTTTTTVWIAVGSQGGTTTERGTDINVGGWNGGGNVGYQGNGYRKGGGGGATHFALSKQGDGQLKNYESKKEDVLLVAGGGGGTGGYSSSAYTNGSNTTVTTARGGNGGGDTGGTSTGWYTASNPPSTGGSQTEGGKCTNYVDRCPPCNGSFGQGGNGI